jgi:hypothetical protein
MNSQSQFPQLHRQPVLQIALLACFALSVTSCATRAANTVPEQRDRMTVNYQYKRPIEFAYPNELPVLLPDATSVDKSESRMAAVAKALGVKLNVERTKTKSPKDGETREYRDGTRRWKVYPRSGMIKYVDQTLYNQLPARLASQRVLSEVEAISGAKRLIRRLANAGLIDEAQILWNAPHVYYSRMQGSTGRPKNGKAERKTTPLRNVDTRVFLPRIVNGIPVSGDNVRIVFTPGGQVSSLNLMWRDLHIGQKNYRRTLDMEHAKDTFQRSLRAPQGSLVEVIVNELVYRDPSTRDAVSFLEPGFLFVYVVKTPLRDRPGVFAVSKKLQGFMPAVEHDLKQLPSLRKARLAELAKRFGKADHPKYPIVPKRKTEGENLR